MQFFFSFLEIKFNQNLKISCLALFATFRSKYCNVLSAVIKIEISQNPCANSIFLQRLLQRRIQILLVYLKEVTFNVFKKNNK